jgi:hypothetical protein
MLVAPSSSWRGTDGRGMTVDEFAQHVQSLNLANWKPDFVVLHNTAAPTSKQWKSSPIPQRLRNLTDYYRGMGWHAGPHMFIDDTTIWLFTPLTEKGVHSPSWNSVAWGIEMVGDYDVESFESGFGLGVRKNAEGAMAALLKKIEKPCNSTTLRLHKEDSKTTHDCPGKHVVKSTVIEEVQARMAVPVDAPPPLDDLGADRFRVYMTEFGGPGDTQESAYGGMVNPRAFQSAVPCKVPKEQRAIAIYYEDRTVISQINDLGPWNKTDDYWNGTGVPKCVSQKANGTKAQNNMVPTNIAGLDSTPAVFEELGIPGKPGYRSATIIWEFVKPPLDETDEGEHPLPPPDLPTPPTEETKSWFKEFSNWVRGLFQ